MISDLGRYHPQAKGLRLAEGSGDGEHFRAIKYFLIKYVHFLDVMLLNT